MFSDWISVDIPSLLRTTLFKPLLSSLPVTQWELRGPIFNMMTVGGPASRVCQCRRLLQGYEINVFFIIKPHVFFFFFLLLFLFFHSSSQEHQMLFTGEPTSIKWKSARRERKPETYTRIMQWQCAERQQTLHSGSHLEETGLHMWLSGSSLLLTVIKMSHFYIFTPVHIYLAFPCEVFELGALRWPSGKVFLMIYLIKPLVERLAVQLRGAKLRTTGKSHITTASSSLTSPSWAFRAQNNAFVRVWAAAATAAGGGGADLNY